MGCRWSDRPNIKAYCATYYCHSVDSDGCGTAPLLNANGIRSDKPHVKKSTWWLAQRWEL